MGKPTGFLEIEKQEMTYLSKADRVKGYQEFLIPLSDEALSDQGARCMDCGIPFCHQGCPVDNRIPDWNDKVYLGEWRDALDLLHSTNNFPEFTGRICPAPCEASCTLNIVDKPVSIKTIECAIVDKGFESGWIAPQINPNKTGKSVAVVGSGPSGLACAQQLVRTGHAVTLFEKESVAGGLLRLGIPDFKLDKAIVQRRVDQLIAEGVDLQTNSHIGLDVSFEQINSEYDAVVLTGGSEKPRDLSIEGRDISGVYFAMDFLKANSKWVQKIHGKDKLISAKDKHVVVIGGGDTGSDCVGTSNRHGAKSVTQLEITPKPPVKENKDLTWPNWPNKLRTSSSQEEGCKRLWQVATKEFIGEDGHLKAIRCVKVEWQKDDIGRWQMNEVADSGFTLEADLITLAMGFAHPIHEGMLKQSGVALSAVGNVDSSDKGERAYQTSVDKIFVAGDMRRGQSLVVWAIREGRRCAKAVDDFLMGQSCLSL